MNKNATSNATKWSEQIIKCELIKNRRKEIEWSIIEKNKCVFCLSCFMKSMCIHYIHKITIIIGSVENRWLKKARTTIVSASSLSSSAGQPVMLDSIDNKSNDCDEANMREMRARVPDVGADDAETIAPFLRAPAHCSLLGCAVDVTVRSHVDAATAIKVSIKWGIEEAAKSVV